MQQVIEEAESSVISGTVNSLSVSRFNHFQIPGREFIPEQFINSHQCFAQTVFAEQVRYFGSYLVLFDSNQWTASLAASGA